MSADHCKVKYSTEMGWTISEKDKSKLSSNGTYVFMKTQKYMDDKIPSEMIELHDNMVISFVNYSVRVSLE